MDLLGLSPLSGFNEAGADCPGMLLHSALDRDVLIASMRPGQTAPECGAHLDLIISINCASMRPGQTAPECAEMAARFERGPTRFNEAGADCPGMPLEEMMLNPIRRGFASMRPGQTAPECQAIDEDEYRDRLLQ